jgi:hypothetical protein
MWNTTSTPHVSIHGVLRRHRIMGLVVVVSVSGLDELVLISGMVVRDSSVTTTRTTTCLHSPQLDACGLPEHKDST